ncbi:MAG: outer membrane protein assembly factor BamE [Gammaproteobacteria bacterium]|nr:outer membrane protein assembly factor BamE [Gammaproteobacteria bacterium]
MLKKLTILMFVCLVTTTGCNLIYKQNVQQGNAIEQDKLDQLRTGMTMSQVAFLLGTPAIRDPFHQDRWDYVYTYARRGANQVSRQVTLRFEDAVLVAMTGISEEADGQPMAASDAGAKAAPESVDSAIDAAPETQITALEAPRAETVEENAELPSGEAEQLVEEVTEDAIQSGVEGTIAAEVEAPAPADSFEPPSAVLEHADALAVQEFSDWVIQIGAFDSLQNARNLVSRIRNAGFNVTIYSQVVGGLGERFLVRSDPFESKAEAERQLQQINQAFELDGFLIPPAP